MAAPAESKAAAAEPTFIGKLRISYTDGNTELQEFAVEAARSALNKHAKGSLKHFSDVAQDVRAQLCDKFKGTWHCIVGKSFGSMVTQETGQLMYFFFGQVGFLVFKHG